MVIVASKGSVGWLSRQDAIDAMPRVNLIGVSDVTFILSAQIYRGALRVSLNMLLTHYPFLHSFVWWRGRRLICRPSLKLCPQASSLGDSGSPVESRPKSRFSYLCPQVLLS